MSPSESTDGVRLVISIMPEAYERMQEMKKVTSIEDDVELIRIALWYYDCLLIDEGKLSQNTNQKIKLSSKQVLRLVHDKKDY